MKQIKSNKENILIVDDKPENLYNLNSTYFIFIPSTTQ